jgi:hypothetical protein
MAAVGTYAATAASKAALEAAILEAMLHARDVGGCTIEEQAQRLAAAISTWIASVPVVVVVQPTDAGLQVVSSPGQPTAPPYVPMELLGSLKVGA